MTPTFPIWAPPRLVRWLVWTDEVRSRPQSKLYFRLIRDSRMRDVWQWHDTAVAALLSSGTALKGAMHPYFFCIAVWRAANLPRKPDNLPPKTRAGYLKSVVGHAGALRELLTATRFDIASEAGPTSELTPEELGSPLQQAISVNFPDEGPIFAFVVENDTARRAPQGYPQTHFTQQLDEVIEWARRAKDWKDTDYPRGVPITRSNANDSRVGYFARKMDIELSSAGLSMPFAHLATLAGVALELRADELVDEDTIRKQIARFRQRCAD